MRLDSALIKSRPQYISAQKVSTLFDALDEREIARKFQMREHSWPCQFHIIIIIATIFNEECPTYETDSKFSIRIQEMTENRVSEVKKDHAQNMSRHNKTTK